MTLFPLAEAIGRGDMMGVGMTLGGIAAGVGGDLVAEQVQRWADRTEEEATAELDQAIAESAELRQALDATLQSDEPDLGTVQRVKRFFQEKGGWLATAGLALLSNPSVVAVVQAASKRLLGGSA